jgi:hypothetical protein
MVDLTHIYEAIDALQMFLLDNTDKCFEEIPEIDEVRLKLMYFADENGEN